MNWNNAHAALRPSWKCRRHRMHASNSWWPSSPQLMAVMVEPFSVMPLVLDAIVELAAAVIPRSRWLS